MGVSDWVPLASVIATATVGLGVPLVTARTERGKIAAQADESRRDELRAVIDEAGAELTAAIQALDALVELAAEADKRLSKARIQWLRATVAWQGAHLAAARAGTEFTDPEPPEPGPERIPLAEYQRRLAEVSAYGNRLAVRVGSDDEMYRQYHAADASLRLAAYPLEDFVEGRVRLNSIDLRDRARRASDIQDAFHDAAAQRVGLKRRS